MGIQPQGNPYARYFGLSAGGLVVRIQLSKNGGGLADPAAGHTTLSDLTGGLYLFMPGTGDVDTLGQLGYCLTDDGSGAPLTPADCQDTVCVQPIGGDVINVRGDVEGNVVGNVAGNVNGKVLGFGSSALHAVGVEAALGAGAITDATITGPAPGAGPATSPLGMLQQIWRRFFKKVAKDGTGLTIKTYANDNSTVYTTQAYTASGANEEVDSAL